MWGKIPLQKEPEDGDPNTEEGMVNALLMNGDGEDAVFETFADVQECDPLTLVFDEEGKNGSALSESELEKLRECDEHCEHSDGCVCPFCENSPNYQGPPPRNDDEDDGGVDPRLAE